MYEIEWITFEGPQLERHLESGLDETKARLRFRELVNEWDTQQIDVRDEGGRVVAWMRW